MATSDTITRPRFFAFLASALMAGLVVVCGCSTVPETNIGAPRDSGVSEPTPPSLEPRPARPERAPVGYSTPSRKPEWYEVALALPALFFAGVPVQDDVVDGPPPDRLISAEMRRRHYERRSTDDWLPPQTVEALKRAFDGRRGEEFLDPDRKALRPDPFRPEQEDEDR